MVGAPIVFRCLHLVYGVGTVPVAALSPRATACCEGLRLRSPALPVATSSHCHALAATLEVAPVSP